MLRFDVLRSRVFPQIPKICLESQLSKIIFSDAMLGFRKKLPKKIQSFEAELMF